MVLAQELAEGGEEVGLDEAGEEVADVGVGGGGGAGGGAL